MIINNLIIRELEHTYRRPFPADLKQYLLSKYAEEPFPFEYSEQDLYANICNDIRNYDSGKLDATIKTPSEHWQEERIYLQRLYIEKCCLVRDLEEYINKLELILTDHGLESSRMIERQTQLLY